MDWSASVDSYCERLDPSFWAEPLNAVTNVAFLIAAWVAWRRIGPEGRADAGLRALVAILVAIGVGSFLFHTFAQRWAGVADVAPILLFILTYIYLATGRVLGQPAWVAALAVPAYFVWSAAISLAIAAMFGPLNGSENYAPVALLILVYAGLAAWRGKAETARGLAIGGALLIVSLTFRTLDREICGLVPIGTHFLWHLINGVMLGWMIVVLARHDARNRRLARPGGHG